MPETVQSLRWHVGCTVDGDVYRRLLELCKVHRIELPDLVGYLLSVGLHLSIADLVQAANVDIDRVFN